MQISKWAAGEPFRPGLAYSAGGYKELQQYKALGFNLLSYSVTYPTRQNAFICVSCGFFLRSCGRQRGSQGPGPGFSAVRFGNQAYEQHCLETGNTDSRLHFDYLIEVYFAGENTNLTCFRKPSTDKKQRARIIPQNMPL